MDEILCVVRSYCNGVTNSLVAHSPVPLLQNYTIGRDSESLIWYSVQREMLLEFIDLVCN